MSSNQLAINVENAIKIFTHQVDGSKISALNGCDLQVKFGELIAIIGPSGAGKTTLLRVIAGTENISSGNIEIGGITLQDWNEKKRREFRRRYIGIFSQQARENLDPRMKVVDAIKWETLNSGWSVENTNKRVDEILSKLEINHLKNTNCGKLSAGEAMRVSLAKAVAKKPYIVLADEPTGQLDTENMLLLFKLMKEITKEGTSVIVATHDIRFQSLADRSLLILDGRLASEEEGKELLLQHQKHLNIKEDEKVKRNLILSTNNSITFPDTIKRRLGISKQLIIQHNINEDFAIVKRNPSDEFFNAMEDDTNLKEFSRLNVSDKTIIKATGLTKIYKTLLSSNQVLDSIDIEIRKGEFVILLGPSGVGKTTLLNLIAGLENISDGKLNVLNSEYTDSNIKTLDKLRLGNISYLTQNYVLHPYLSVEENTFLPQMFKINSKLIGQSLTKETLNMLNLLEIKNYSKVYPTELSGGQQQRNSLAASLVKDSEIILADEPTANLDTKLARKVINLLVDFSEEGKTAIVATHDFTLIQPGYRVIRIENKKIASDIIADAEYCTSLQLEYLKH